MHNFTYQKASSVADAAIAVAKAKDGVLLAGGMTLLPVLKMRLAQPSDIVDLVGIDALISINRNGDSIDIGAMTTHATVAASDVVQQAIPALASLAGGIGDPQVRNRGTIGGSVANADPAADYPAAVVGLGATVHTNNRSIAADDFFTGMFETALDENEVIIRISFPIPKKAAYQKFPNPASRYAIVGVMIADTANGPRVAVTGAAPCVYRATDMEIALASNFSTDAIAAVNVSAEEMNGDIHASAEYRAHLVTVMAKRAIASM